MCSFTSPGSETLAQLFLSMVSWTRGNEGWAALGGGDKSRLNLVLRKAWQNFPAGFEASDAGLTCLLWPRGSFWPRTLHASGKGTYQFEGKRYKTYEMLLGACPDNDTDGMAKGFDRELRAMAPFAWYVDTGAIWPLAPVGVGSPDPKTQEAIARYDRLQLAKVYKDQGDPAEPDAPAPPTRATPSGPAEKNKEHQSAGDAVSHATEGFSFRFTGKTTTKP